MLISYEKKRIVKIPKYHYKKIINHNIPKLRITYIGVIGVLAPKPPQSTPLIQQIQQCVKCKLKLYFSKVLFKNIYL